MLSTILIMLVLAKVIMIYIIIEKSTYNKQLSFLLSDGSNTAPTHYNEAQIAKLPAPVQRYFKNVLKEGQPYINYVRLKHGGQFKTNIHKAWKDINGEEYFTTNTPGFIWKGTTRLFSAIDKYVNKNGELKVLLLSHLPFLSFHGEEYNKGELIRWLSESVWFPTNLLPSERLAWTKMNNTTAQLTFVYNAIRLSIIVTINDAGEIVEMQTKRMMSPNKTEEWVVRLSKYEWINNVKIPTSAMAIWRIKNIDYPYAKFSVNYIDYDIPEKFEE